MKETRAGYRAIYYNDLLALKALFCCFNSQDRVYQFSCQEFNFEKWKF